MREEIHLMQVVQDYGIPEYIGRGYSKTLNRNYIVTELLGPTIKDLLEHCGGKFTLKTSSMLFHQLITRFWDLHKKGIVHCDIKPENILMGLKEQSDTVHLIDFGIS